MLKFFVSLLAAACFVLVSASGADGVKIVLIGDSTLAPKGKDRRPEMGWGEALESQFDGSVTVVNLAVNGRSSKSFIDEGRWETALEELREGDWLFVEFGHNDEKAHDPSRYAEPWGSYSQNLRRFVEGALAKGAHALLMSPICRRHFDESGVLLDTHSDYPAAAKAVSEEEGVSFVDMESRTRRLLEALGPQLSEALFLHLDAGEHVNYPDGKADDTHLNIEGAAVHARLFAQALRDANHPLARRLK